MLWSVGAALKNNAEKYQKNSSPGSKFKIYFILAKNIRRTKILSLIALLKNVFNIVFIYDLVLFKKLSFFLIIDGKLFFNYVNLFHIQSRFQFKTILMVWGRYFRIHINTCILEYLLKYNFMKHCSCVIKLKIFMLSMYGSLLGPI